MIFSLGRTIILITDELYILKYFSNQDSHIWPSGPFKDQNNESFNVSIPKKYYSEQQALIRAKVWLYELLLERKIKKTHENN